MTSVRDVRVFFLDGTSAIVTFRSDQTVLQAVQIVSRSIGLVESHLFSLYEVSKKKGKGRYFEPDEKLSDLFQTSPVFEPVVASAKEKAKIPKTRLELRRTLFFPIQDSFATDTVATHLVFSQARMMIAESLWNLEDIHRAADLAVVQLQARYGSHLTRSDLVETVQFCFRNQFETLIPSHLAKLKEGGGKSSWISTMTQSYFTQPHRIQSEAENEYLRLVRSLPSYGLLLWKAKVTKSVTKLPKKIHFGVNSKGIWLLEYEKFRIFHQHFFEYVTKFHVDGQTVSYFSDGVWEFTSKRAKQIGFIFNQYRTQLLSSTPQDESGSRKSRSGTVMQRPRSDSNTRLQPIEKPSANITRERDSSNPQTPTHTIAPITRTSSQPIVIPTAPSPPAASPVSTPLSSSPTSPVAERNSGAKATSPTLSPTRESSQNQTKSVDEAKSSSNAPTKVTVTPEKSAEPEKPKQEIVQEKHNVDTFLLDESGVSVTEVDSEESSFDEDEESADVPHKLSYLLSTRPTFDELVEWGIAKDPFVVAPMLQPVCENLSAWLENRKSVDQLRKRNIITDD